jgi:hypothetical protein
VGKSLITVFNIEKAPNLTYQLVKFGAYYFVFFYLFNLGINAKSLSLAPIALPVRFARV